MSNRSDEYADAQRTLGTFPSEWGFPEGSQWSETRARWVKARVEVHERDPMRNLARTATRLGNGYRLEHLEALRAD